MDTPALVLVPPTPIKFDSSQHTPPIEQTRASSETAIFSIYSMYADDRATRSTWTASPPLDLKPLDVPDTLLTDNDNDLFFTPTDFDHSSLAYCQPDIPVAADHIPRVHRRPPSDIPLPNGTHPLRSSALTATSSHDSRRSLSTLSSKSPGHSSKTSDPSSPSTQNRNSNTLSTPEFIPLARSSITTPPQTPPRQHSPRSSMVIPRKHITTPISSSPGSKVSLVPSEGEDVDAFHVRSTYAQLEMSGVKGDGFEEGIERTRARVGVSRASRLRADAALGDGSEKNRDLDPQEIHLLHNIDRYGFFSVPSHDRLVLLYSAPLHKRLKRTTAKTHTAPPNATSLPSLPKVPSPSRKELSRISKWTRMLQPDARDQGANIEAWRIRPSKEPKLRERTFKGIPDRWRTAAWDLLMSRYSKSSPRDMARLGKEYRDALDKPSNYDIQIDLDVPRTISGHIMFKTRYGAGQRALFYVLHTFSLRCPTCGYVQGMGPIAATLLCYFEPERVYASLVRLHDAYNMHAIFNPGFPGLLEAIYVQERITEHTMPDVFSAFRKHMISTTSYATKWYITLFANSVPFQTQLRLWDAFLLEGDDVFVAVAVAIVWVYRDHITSASANFETVLSLLSSFFVPEDENAFLLWIGQTLADKKIRANIRVWRNDWKALVALGKEGDALL